jgi:hypothetical protein
MVKEGIYLRYQGNCLVARETLKDSSLASIGLMNFIFVEKIQMKKKTEKKDLKNKKVKEK